MIAEWGNSSLGSQTLWTLITDFFVNTHITCHVLKYLLNWMSLFKVIYKGCDYMYRCIDLYSYNPTTSVAKRQIVPLVWLYQFNRLSKQKSIASILRNSALYLGLMDGFFAVILVNSCKLYSSSFSDILGTCIASAVSFQMMADSGEETSGEQRFQGFQSTCGQGRLNRGLALIV